METNVHGVLCFHSCNHHLLHCTMTIDSSWLAGMKCDSPDAFTMHAPFAPQGVFLNRQNVPNECGTDPHVGPVCDSVGLIVWMVDSDGGGGCDSVG